MKNIFNKSLLDFDLSFIGWELKDKSLGLFQIDAKFEDKKTREKYYLSKSVMAGNVYGKSILPIIPNYNYQWITNGKSQIVFRTFSNNEIKIDPKISTKVFRFFLNIKKKQKKEILINDLIENPNLFNESLICIIDLFDQIVEFPIKHINIHQNDSKFQIETGPILIKKNEKFISAFIFLNSENKCQIVWHYPMLEGKIEELPIKMRFFVNA